MVFLIGVTMIQDSITLLINGVQFFRDDVKWPLILLWLVIIFSLSNLFLKCKQMDCNSRELKR